VYWSEEDFPTTSHYVSGSMFLQICGFSLRYPGEETFNDLYLVNGRNGISITGDLHIPPPHHNLFMDLYANGFKSSYPWKPCGFFPYWENPPHCLCHSCLYSAYSVPFQVSIGTSIKRSPIEPPPPYQTPPNKAMEDKLCYVL
jgi:hypothetical protein